MSLRNRATIGVLIVLIVTFIAMRNQNKSDNEYFKNLDLNMKAIVSNTFEVNGSNGFDVVDVVVLSSNKYFHDPRGTYENYYCIIKNGLAEVYQLGGAQASIGDTIEINTLTKRFTIKKAGGDIVEEIRINSNGKYYEYLKEHYQKF